MQETAESLNFLQQLNKLIMTRTELLESFLKPTDLTVKELIDRNAFAQIMQFAEAYHLEQLRIGGVSKSFNSEEELLQFIYMHAPIAIKPKSKRAKAQLISASDLLSAAPKMLEALQNLENDDNQIPEHAWRLVQAAIKSALGNED